MVGDDLLPDGSISFDERRNSLRATASDLLVCVVATRNLEGREQNWYRRKCQF